MPRAQLARNALQTIAATKRMKMGPFYISKATISLASRWFVQNRAPS